MPVNLLCGEKLIDVGQKEVDKISLVKNSLGSCDSGNFQNTCSADNVELIYDNSLASRR